VQFDAEGTLWVLDFGFFEMTPAGATAVPETGAVYRVTDPS
jgi:hypothetical protein